MVGDLKAVGDMVIIKEHHAEKMGKIILPDSTKQYNADYYGEVVAVGSEYKYDVKVGDKIFYPRHEGIGIRHFGEEFTAMKSMHVWGVIYD